LLCSPKKKGKKEKKRTKKRKKKKKKATEKNPLFAPKALLGAALSHGLTWSRNLDSLKCSAIVLVSYRRRKKEKRKEKKKKRKKWERKALRKIGSTAFQHPGGSVLTLNRKKAFRRFSEKKMKKEGLACLMANCFVIPLSNESNIEYTMIELQGILESPGSLNSQELGSFQVDGDASTLVIVSH
jgi:hypothetical protein